MESKTSKYARHTLCNRKLLGRYDCKGMCRDCQVFPHAYTCTCLDATLHATINKYVLDTYVSIHLVHMETSDNVVCKDRTSADIDYSYFSNVLSSKNKKKQIRSF